LIPDAAHVEADWYRRTGIYPIHGTIVIKEDVLRKHPFVARSLFDAFVAAKQPYLERLRAGQGSAPEDLRYRSFAPLMSDPLPYGMKANKASIEALVTYAVQQELIPKRPAPGEVFADPEAM
jgi:4,5-dihydroxyphthalate decarboxylase